ncbi:MAG: ATP-binding protein [Dehalococcoidia bacterium]
MPVHIEYLRLLPPEERLGALLKTREDQWLERKGGRVQARAVGETLVAFANAEGGLLAVGLGNGAVSGIKTADENELRQAARNFTEPPVRHSFELLPAVNERGEADRIALIEVEASEHVHRMSSGEVFLRVGDENRKLRELEVVELEYDKGQSAFDGRAVPGAGLDDLDEGLLDQYFARLQPHKPGLEVLEARGLLTRNGRTLVPTTAGVLVFGRSPQRFLPEAWVRVIEYRGRTRLLGAAANIVADRRFEGPLPEQLRAVREHLKQTVATAIRLGAGGRFQAVPLIPEQAWQEAVTNAVIHRSYSMAGDHIRVELFDDRLEVESPGRFPGLVRIDNIRSTRFARNPRIARALADLGYGRELGEGVDRMFEEMERAGLSDPLYEQRPASVRVSLIADPELARVLAALPPWLARVLEAVDRAGGQATTSGIMERIGGSRPTILKHLSALERQGLVEHIGVARDPRGYWRMIGRRSE